VLNEFNRVAFPKKLVSSLLLRDERSDGEPRDRKDDHQGRKGLRKAS
jgi:hypothetical protein